MYMLSRIHGIVSVYSPGVLIFLHSPTRRIANFVLFCSFMFLLTTVVFIHYYHLSLSFNHPQNPPTPNVTRPSTRSRRMSEDQQSFGETVVPMSSQTIEEPISLVHSNSHNRRYSLFETVSIPMHEQPPMGPEDHPMAPRRMTMPWRMPVPWQSLANIEGSLPPSNNDNISNDHNHTSNHISNHHRSSSSPGGHVAELD